MAEIVWAVESELWLHEIYEYIALDNPRYALKTVNKIREKVLLLKEFPNIGYKYEHRSQENIRIILYGHYRIAYLAGDDSIKILGVFHGALDIERYL